MDECLITFAGAETQTQSQSTDLECSQEEGKAPWGRLCSCIPNLTSVDLYEESYVLGRAPEGPGCNIIITHFKQHEISNVSKKHFQIVLKDNLALLTDFSKNGTFINGGRVGKLNQRIVSSNDVIALGQPSNRAFIFIKIDESDSAFLPLQLRKKYHVGGILGTGACGEVRLVYNKQSCQPFALKKIIKAKSSNCISDLINDPQKIQTEIDILTSFSYPFIIKMQEVHETESDVLIVLDYMKGGELTNRILSITPFPESEVKFIFYQIVLGVRYLHNNGVSHRDLKAQNILVASDDRYPIVKISDFGLSKILDDASFMETICGTISYVAPEVLKFSEKYSKKVDIWSLGVLLFFMLSKVLPFQGDRKSIFRKVMEGNVDWEDEVAKAISAQAKDLIKKMLTVNPNQRISINGIIDHPWISRDMSLQYRLKKLLKQENISLDLSDEDELDVDPNPRPCQRVKTQNLQYFNTF